MQYAVAIGAVSFKAYSIVLYPLKSKFTVEKQVLYLREKGFIPNSPPSKAAKLD